MRVYLTDKLSDDQVRDMGFLRAHNYLEVDGQAFLNFSNEHLDLMPESFISEKVIEKFTGEISHVTMMIGTKWVYNLSRHDGEMFTHGDAQASYRLFVKNGLAQATLLISGKTVKSVLEMLKLMKNGDMKSEQDIREDLRKTRKVADQLKGFFDGVSGKLGVSEIALKRTEKERDEAQADLRQLVAHLRMPWWKRLIARKPDVYSKFKLAIV